jgi:hypothetical protein
MIPSSSSTSLPRERGGLKLPCLHRADLQEHVGGGAVCKSIRRRSTKRRKWAYFVNGGQSLLGPGLDWATIYLNFGQNFNCNVSCCPSSREQDIVCKITTTTFNCSLL